MIDKIRIERNAVKNGEASFTVSIPLPIEQAKTTAESPIGITKHKKEIINKVADKKYPIFTKKKLLKNSFKKYSIGDEITEKINAALRFIQTCITSGNFNEEIKNVVIEDLLSLDDLLTQFEKSSTRVAVTKYNRKNKEDKSSEHL